MGGTPFDRHRPIPIENKRRLIKVKAVAVEAVDGDSPAGIDIIADSELALYRIKIETLKALSLQSGMLQLISGRVLGEMMRRQ